MSLSTTLTQACHRREKGRCRVCDVPVTVAGASYYLLHPAQHRHPSTADVVTLCRACLLAVKRRDLGLSGNADSTLTAYGVVRDVPQSGRLLPIP